MKTNNNSRKQYFSAYFGQKQSMEKIPLFDQTHGLTLWENSNFFHFLKRNLCVQESVLFYLEYQQKIFLGLFCPKTNYGKNSNFWPKPWTLQNFEFFTLFKKKILYLKESLLFYLEYQQTIFLGLFPQKQTMEKIQIFDQNHALTPLQKFEFCHFLKRHFYLTEYLVSI